MSAWGAEIFENDEAADWVIDLEQSQDASFLLKTLFIAIEEKVYLESPEAECALAAAEVIASSFGETHPKLPEEVKTWITNHNIRDNKDLPAIAIQAVERISRDSELEGSWTDSNYEKDWRQVVNHLKERLEAVA